MPHEVELPDVLVTDGAEVAAEGVGVRTGLDILVRYRGGDDAAPGLDDILFDKSALGGGEDFLRPPELQESLRHFNSFAAFQFLGRADQQLHSLLERNGERVLGHVVGPRRHKRFLGRQDDAFAFEARARMGNGHGLRGHAKHFILAQLRRRGEPPGAVDDDAYTEALGLRGRDGLGLAVLRFQALAAAAQHADVAVARAFRLNFV